jgi:hypothetical protein
LSLFPFSWVALCFFSNEISVTTFLASLFQI